MKIRDAFRELDNFKDALDKHCHVMAFTLDKMKPREKLFKEWFREEVPSPGVSGKSGVYLIADPTEELLYIGKATADNLEAEIYGKFRAASRFDDSGAPFFDNSPLARWASKEEDRNLIISGDVLIASIVIDPREFASLVEVYLQTYCHACGDWPHLNKQIG